MPARSIAQQRFMGMVHAEKEGKLDKSKLDPEFAAKIERVAASIKAKAARDLAETKHKKLPKKVKKKSPPEGDSRGQNKKAEFDRLKEVGDSLKYHKYHHYKVQTTPPWSKRWVPGDEGFGAGHAKNIKRLTREKNELLKEKGMKKKAEYIMNKLAAKKYPIPLEGTPSPHLLAKPLIKKIPIFGEG